MSNEIESMTDDIQNDQQPDHSVFYAEEGEPLSSAAAPPQEDSKGVLQDESPLDDGLAAQAKEFGLSDEDLKSLGPDKVQSLIDGALMSAFRNQQQQQQQSFQQWPQQGPPGTPWQQNPSQPVPGMGSFPQPQQQFPEQNGNFFPQQPQPPVQDPIALQIQKIKDVKFDPEVYGDEMTEYTQTVNAMLEHMNQALQTQQMEYQNYVSQQIAQQEQQFAAWFDESLSKLDDDSSAFGTGSIFSIPQNSPQFAARQEVFRIYDFLAQQSGLDPNARNDGLLAQAARMAGHTMKPSNKKLSRNVSERRRQTVGRPSGSQSALSNERDPESGLSRATVEKFSRVFDKVANK